MVRSSQPAIRYSQNFLINTDLVDQLLGRSTIASGDTVLEIGAGRGLITDRLARRCARVIAIEKDAHLLEVLRRRFAEQSNVKVIQADILTCSLPGGSYKVFANIPFGITTRIVSRLTDRMNPPLDAYLVVQREAAGRFIGSPTGTLWAALLEPWFEATLVHQFRRTDFVPAPGVDVVLLRLRKRGPPLVDPREAQLYRDFVTYCFTARRPTLRHTLEKLLGARCARAIADSTGVRPDDTPSTVCSERWVTLFEAFRAAGRARSRRRVANAERWLRADERRLVKVHRTRVRQRSSHLPADRKDARIERPAGLRTRRPPPAA